MELMKKTFMCSLLLALIPCLGWADQGDVTIAGKIEGIEQGRLLMVVRTGESRQDTLAYADFKSPRFTLKAHLEEPIVAMLVIAGYNGGFQLFAEPNTRYEALLSNGNDSYIRGGKMQAAYQSYGEDIQRQKKKINQLEELYDSLKRAMKYRSASLVNDSIEQYRHGLQETADRFHADNDNLLSAYDALATAQSKNLNATESMQLFDKLGAGARSSICGRILQQRIVRLGKLSSGRLAPDFTMPTIDNKPFTLSKMLGKIKIVDFWASWCGPCRLNNPSLKRIYAAYHAKGLEIVSVSLDDKRASWEDAVRKDALPWAQVSSLKGWNDEAARTYNVTAIPAIFILDADNHIIARDLRGDALEDFLGNHLK